MIKYQVAEVQGGKEEQYNMITVPRGGEFTLILSDGTQVWLNAETSLRYPVEFVGNERKVYLEGEAFFDVTYDKQKQFVVEYRCMEQHLMFTLIPTSMRWRPLWCGELLI